MRDLYASRRSGVALILVLGLLSVLTMLAVAFSISMRVERVASHNYSNEIRAREMTSVALTRAVEKISSLMFTNCYPHWEDEPTKARDAISSEEWPSGSGVSASSILTTEVKDLIPGSLRSDATLAASKCYWHNIPGPGGTNLGRVAFIVVNCSGLLDANYVGGADQRIASTNINELDVSILPEFGNDTNNAKVFVDQRRTEHNRYETIMELATLNDGIAGPSSNGVVSNFFTYSYDSGRDMMYTNKGLIGQRYVQLMPKYSINNIFTSWPAFTDPTNVSPDKYFTARGQAGLPNKSFTNYYLTVSNYMCGNGSFISSNSINRPDDVLNNLLNYLDSDRIPQSSEENDASDHSEGGEAVPLINEIVLMQGFTTSTTPQYAFSVELWYPFVPRNVAAGEFELQFCAFTNNVDLDPNFNLFGSDELAKGNWLTNACYTNWSFIVPIGEMSFYENNGTNQYRVYSSPFGNWISFPTNQIRTSPVLGAVGPNFTNQVWIHVNVIDSKTGYRVDQAMELGTEAFSNTVGYSVDDPRSNGRRHYWRDADPANPGNRTLAFPPDGSYPMSQATLGAENKHINARNRKGQGVPIFIRDGPMRNIGEVGHLYAGNLNNIASMPAQDQYWQSINILSYDFGGFLLDRLTVRPTNDVEKSSVGLVCIGTAQTNVLRALFNNMHIGTPEEGVTLKGDALPVNDLITCLITNGPYWTFQEMFTADWDGGPLGSAFRNLQANTNNMNDIIREDGLRNIVDLISFRQNIYQVVMAAQVFGLDGTTVVAEKRGLATVYRDSYTGEFFIRSFQWLQED